MQYAFRIYEYEYSSRSYIPTNSWVLPDADLLFNLIPIEQFKAISKGTAFHVLEDADQFAQYFAGLSVLLNLGIGIGPLQTASACSIETTKSLSRKAFAGFKHFNTAVSPKDVASAPVANISMFEEDA